MVNGMIKIAYAGLTERLNHRNGWVVYLISKPNVTYNLFTGPTEKEPPEPKPRLMMMKQIDWDYDPMEDKYWLEGRDCITKSSVNPVM